MAKGKLILIVLICFVIAIVATVFFFRPNLEKIDIDRNGSLNQTDSVPQAITKIFPPEDNGKYTIQVEYPELRGVSAPGVQEKVNGAVRAGVYNQIAAFQANNANNSQLGDEEFKSSFDGSFEVVLLTRSFFSAVMSYSDYSAGAAHPNSYNVTLNYNLKTGEMMSLDNFLKSLNPSAGYMDRLGKYVKDDLVKQFGDSQDSLDAINFGGAPTAENYANFTLDTIELSIHFDPYQVAPYAVGSPVVKIQYKDLLDSVIRSSTAVPAAGATYPAGTATSSVEWWLK